MCMSNDYETQQASSWLVDELRSEFVVPPFSHDLVEAIQLSSYYHLHVQVSSA